MVLRELLDRLLAPLQFLLFLLTVLLRCLRLLSIPRRDAVVLGQLGGQELLGEGLEGAGGFDVGWVALVSGPLFWLVWPLVLYGEFIAIV